MTIEIAIASLLKDVAGIPSSQIHQGIAPAGAIYPFVTIQRVTGERYHSLDGSSGLARPRFQLDCWGKTFRDAKALFETIRAALDGYRGTVAGIRIGSCLLVNEQHSIETQRSESDTPLHRIMSEFSIIHTE